MSRSYVAGSVTGVVLSLVGFGVISTVAAPPPGHRDHTEPPEETATQAPTSAAPSAVVPASPKADAPKINAPDAEAALTEAVVTEDEAPAATESGTADTPQAAILDVPEGSEFDVAKGDTAAALPEAEPAPEVAADQAADAPTAEPAPALAETAPPAAPDSGPVATLNSDQAATEAVTPDLPDADAPVAEPAAAAALEAPEGSAHASGAGQEGGPPAPGQSVDIALAEPVSEPQTAGQSPAAPVGDTAVEPLPEPAPEVPASEPPAAEEPAVAAETSPDATVAEAAPVPEPVTEPAAETLPETVTEPAPEAAAQTATEAEAEAEVQAEEPASQPEAAPEALPEESGKPKILTLDPATVPEGQGTAALGREVPGVKILKRPGSEGAAPDQPAGLVPEAEAVPDATAEAVPDDGLPPLRAFAAAFENPDARPALAVVILDVGAAAGGLDPSALTALPFAATVAVDPLAADAAEREAALRAAGAEVAILAGDLPQGATPADMEVAYQSYVQALPQSVALIGLPGASFQKQSLDAQHMAALLAADGRGFITFAQGLNAARRAAEKAGAPVASVDRLVTAEDAKGGALARELDKLAFIAAQKGSAVIALPSTAEAITGLIAWSGSNAARSVALAPVSALMTANGG
ncbi:divergent polysaccharide deacetylase family protein [Frigidibacter sp. SD6-1]|uniref:divergent polysaccharide deacetylase family protein n=1 Tax=Frigidibacter sp. SD6-1 TaxID=3032581 RepID=UPI0024DF6527|nr:divergent polysaccharide deacetylase family protein [Frigidibacter sp. SD6-1]